MHACSPRLGFNAPPHPSVRERSRRPPQAPRGRTGAGRPLGVRGGDDASPHRPFSIGGHRRDGGGDDARGGEHLDAMPRNTLFSHSNALAPASIASPSVRTRDPDRSPTLRGARRGDSFASTTLVRGFCAAPNLTPPGQCGRTVGVPNRRSTFRRGPTHERASNPPPNSCSARCAGRSSRRARFPERGLSKIWSRHPKKRRLLQVKFLGSGGRASAGAPLGLFFVEARANLALGAPHARGVLTPRRA